MLFVLSDHVSRVTTSGNISSIQRVFGVIDRLFFMTQIDL